MKIDDFMRCLKYDWENNRMKNSFFLSSGHFCTVEDGGQIIKLELSDNFLWISWIWGIFRRFKNFSMIIILYIEILNNLTFSTITAGRLKRDIFLHWARFFLSINELSVMFDKARTKSLQIVTSVFFWKIFRSKHLLVVFSVTD